MNNLKIPVLNHGYVTLLNLSGPVRRTATAFDADIVDIAKSARISFGNFDKERTIEQDIKLVNYLIKNFHNTPVEMIETWWEMKLPIFIARQFIRHRTACVNEISARYSTLPEEWYIPEIVGGKPTTGAKQGQEDNLSTTDQEDFKFLLDSVCNDSYIVYKSSLDIGVAPEHARMFLHVNHFTTWIWKQDLHNLLHFLKLRLDSHAQIEARLYARAIFKLLVENLANFDKITETLGVNNAN